MASILYLGTDEGVVTLKSEDGRSWKIEHHGLKDWEVPEVAVSPSAPNKVFAGTRGDGVWLSEDFGATWSKPCYGKRGPGKVRCLAIDPQDADTLYAGTEPIDVFISRDGAKSWKQLDSIWNIPWVSTITYPVATVEPHVRDITIDPKDPKTMYVALQVGYMLKTPGRRRELGTFEQESRLRRTHHRAASRRQQQDLHRHRRPRLPRRQGSGARALLQQRWRTELVADGCRV